MVKKKGQFITLEGVEGVGKTTQLSFIAQWLTDNNIEFVATREPGGTDFAEEIRDLLISTRAETVSENTELLLMFAARAQHVAEVITPALTAGKWVLCDRFTDATYAYQGGGRGIASEKIAMLETLVQGDLRPDITFLLDLPAEVGLQRAGKRGKLDRFEQEQMAFFESVRRCYLSMAERFSHRYRVVNAQQSIDDIQRDIAVHLSTFVKERHDAP